MRIELEPDSVALAVYRWWTNVPDWRDASAYPKPDTVLQWFGIEFRLRHPEVRQRLREFLEALSPEQRSLLKEPRGLRIAGPQAVSDVEVVRADDGRIFGLEPDWGDAVGYFQVMFPDWPRPKSWPHFASADQVALGPTGYVHLTFNLRNPIEPQIERARKILRHWQCLLALDEIGECDPKEIGAIVYALGNGRGKQRASRSGNARAVTRWRCFVLSSGERTIGTAMDEGGFRAKAGQSVRLLDVSASRRFGAWDELHGLPSGTAFSDAIKRAAVKHHGHAGRAFLEKLTRDQRDFCDMLGHVQKSPTFSIEESDGQVKRAAGRFALLALAGELATEYGVTGWPVGAAKNAAAECFRVWLSFRGRGKGNDERQQILEHVARFIERHGDSRFSDEGHILPNALIRERAGWWRNVGGGERVYLFTKDGLHEALKGFDFKSALDTLQEAGALPEPDASGKRSKVHRIAGQQMCLYTIHPDKLGGDHEA